MRSARLRFAWLLLLGVLFFGWIGWLGHLVRNRPIVVEHAQVLVADLDVIAPVDSLEEPILVEEVVWSRDPKDKDLNTKKIKIVNLSNCRGDWTGPGQYILPLFKIGEKTFEVANPSGHPDGEQQRPDRQHPLAPGYEPAPPQPPRIYPLTPQTRAQLLQIVKG